MLEWVAWYPDDKNLGLCSSATLAIGIKLGLSCTTDPFQ